MNFRQPVLPRGELATVLNCIRKPKKGVISHFRKASSRKILLYARILSPCYRTVKRKNIYRGIFAAEAEVVKRRRKEAMWALFRAVGQSGWHVGERYSCNSDGNELVTRKVTVASASALRTKSLHMRRLNRKADAPLMQASCSIQQFYYFLTSLRRA
jgi:hypothetical protein